MGAPLLASASPGASQTHHLPKNISSSPRQCCTGQESPPTPEGLYCNRPPEPRPPGKDTSKAPRAAPPHASLEAPEGEASPGSLLKKTSLAPALQPPRTFPLWHRPAPCSSGRWGQGAGQKPEQDHGGDEARAAQAFQSRCCGAGKASLQHSKACQALKGGGLLPGCPRLPASSQTLQHHNAAGGEHRMPLAGVLFRFLNSAAISGFQEGLSCLHHHLGEAQPALRGLLPPPSACSASGTRMGRAPASPASARAPAPGLALSRPCLPGQWEELCSPPCTQQLQRSASHSTEAVPTGDHRAWSLSSSVMSGPQRLLFGANK